MKPVLAHFMLPLIILGLGCKQLDIDSENCLTPFSIDFTPANIRYFGSKIPIVSIDVYFQNKKISPSYYSSSGIQKSNPSGIQKTNGKFVDYAGLFVMQNVDYVGGKRVLGELVIAVSHKNWCSIYRIQIPEHSNANGFTQKMCLDGSEHILYSMDYSENNQKGPSQCLEVRISFANDN